MALQDVRDPASGRLLFKYDPDRDLVEAFVNYYDRDRGFRVRYPVTVDLNQLRESFAEPAPVARSVASCYTGGTSVPA